MTDFPGVLRDGQRSAATLPEVPAVRPVRGAAWDAEAAG